MTPAEMARLHRAAFRADRAWSREEFAQLIEAYGVRSFAVPQGFALTRQIVDEVELLTLAVHPAAQGTGLGRRLMQTWIAHAAGCGAVTAFLEVAADNPRALHLYESLGFRVTGRRPHYYGRSPEPAVDALVMSLALSPLPDP
ncbi:GNAT family N-acetyltransferase [Sulfitobacter sp. LCG007]